MLISFCGGKIVKEVLHTLLRYVLHNDDMSKVSAKSVVIIRSKVVFRYNSFGRYTDGIQLAYIFVRILAGDPDLGQGPAGRPHA